MFLTPRIANERFPATRKKPLEERENARWTEMKRGLRKGLEAYDCRLQSALRLVS